MTIDVGLSSRRPSYSCDIDAFGRAVDIKLPRKTAPFHSSHPNSPELMCSAVDWHSRHDNHNPLVGQAFALKKAPAGKILHELN